MDIKSFYQAHRLNDLVARQADFNPYYPLIQSALDDPLMIDGKEFINLASNNYLGLSNDPRVVNAAINGLKEYGVSMCSTPVAAGYNELFSRAEKALSHFSGLMETLIFPSGYQANNGLFQAIAHSGDLVVVDRFAHSSLVEGIKTAGCNYRPFRHNDLEHLERILERSSRFNQVFVVTESVFSTEGSISPFREINDLCLRFGAIPIVDDSHGIGVIGKTGRGILEYSGIHDYQGIYTASLGKALATTGGMIAGKKSLIEYLRYSVSHLLYSTAILPAALQALLMVLEIIDQEFPVISARLWKYTHMLSMGLQHSGYPLTETVTPIVSVCTGDPVETLLLSKEMHDNGILGTPFIYPSVPEKEGRIRLIAGANLKPESIERAIRIFHRLAKVPV